MQCCVKYVDKFLFDSENTEEKILLVYFIFNINDMYDTLIHLYSQLMCIIAHVLLLSYILVFC